MKLVIKSRIEGRMRAGRRWSRQPIEVDSKDFSKEQLAKLEADPVLTVTRTEEKPKK